jgi:hypothetical protein
MNIFIFILILGQAFDWLVPTESYFSIAIMRGHNPSLYNFQSENEVQRIWDNFQVASYLHTRI